MRTIKLYIDIDGVLLGKVPSKREYCLANQAADFMRFALSNFDCYWLTTHCKGDASVAIDYLRPYANDETLALFEQIKPSTYKTFKTEALDGDFIWIDDQPTAYEIQVLDDNDWLDRWFQINTRKDLNALIDLVPVLQERLQHRGFKAELSRPKKQAGIERYTNPIHTKHFAEGITFEAREIDESLPYVVFFQQDQEMFRLQRDTLVLVLDRIAPSLNLESIVALFHSWLNKSRYNNGQHVFDKLFRLRLEKLTHGEWRNPHYGASGSVEQIIRMLAKKGFGEECKAKPANASNKWVEADIDYSRPFFQFQLARLEIGPYHLNTHIAEVQEGDSGSLHVRFGEHGEWMKHDLIAALAELEELEIPLSQAIQAWADKAKDYREAHRANPHIYTEAPWTKDGADPFMADHSCFHEATLHPIAVNDIGGIHIHHNAAPTEGAHIRIERYALDGRRSTQCVATLSNPTSPPYQLCLHKEWKALSPTQQSEIIMRLWNAIENRFEYPSAELGLLKACIDTKVVPYGDRRHTAKPELTFVYIDEYGSQLGLEALGDTIKQKRVG